MSVPKPLMLCILDGWGRREDKRYNAIETANTAVWHKMWNDCPHTLLHTSGLAVGLPDGQMGNSEVGHTNIGAGRVVMQDLPKISLAIQNGTFAKQPVFVDFVNKMKGNGATCHILGMLSDGGVHSHQEHIVGLVRLLSAQGLRVAVHIFLDGRDTPPDSGLGYVLHFQEQIADCPRAFIATIGGRYYGMDRDNRWDREKTAYKAIVEAEAPRFATAEEAVEFSYKNKIFDEFMEPVVIGAYSGMRDGDGLFMANFRADRVRQILNALLNPDFSGFEREKVVNFAAKAGMVAYSDEISAFLPAVFPDERLENVFGKVLSDNGLRQLRIAETEKYAHVTYFFNGGEEQIFDGEDRILVPSPKVATYDLQPEMSAAEVTDKLVEAIDSGKYDVIVVNYANGDMVGHTGVMEAAVKACETVDKCLARLHDALNRVGGAMLVIADHGNAELMYDEEKGVPFTSHTTFDVPAILVNAPKGVRALADGGKLADVAPTLLDILGIDKPDEMTGVSLLVRD